MSKQPDKTREENETQESLVNSLKSIKELLDKSEEKLSPAHENPTHVNSPMEPLSMAKKTLSSNEPVVPVLDDVVIPGEEVNHREEINNKGENAVVPSENFSTDEVLAYIEGLQNQFEKDIRNTLMRAVVSIETELKKTMAEQFDLIREQIEKNRKG